MPTQLDMLAPPADDAARVIAHRMLQALAEISADADGWMLAADLCLHLGYTPNEQGKRYMRAGAAASRGAIISGPRGYKLTRNATVDELESQAREMADRAAAKYRFDLHNGGR